VETVPFWSRKANADDKVKRLSEYTHGEGPVELLSAVPGDLDVPGWWRDIVGMGRFVRVSAAISQWESIVGKEMSNTISYLRLCLKDVEIMRVGSSYYLLYSIKSRMGEMVYFVGGNPNCAKPNASVQKNWTHVPQSVKSFYELHDGFFDFESAVGFDPLAEVICLGDEDWGIIEQLDLDVPLNMSASLGFFSNRSGGYLVIDTSNSANNNATIWWAVDEPTYDQVFWDVADEWTMIFFEPNAEWDDDEDDAAD